MPLKLFEPSERNEPLKRSNLFHLTECQVDYFKAPTSRIKIE